MQIMSLVLILPAYAMDIDNNDIEMGGENVEWL
jgi:hypothetical protein